MSRAVWPELALRMFGRKDEAPWLLPVGTDHLGSCRAPERSAVQGLILPYRRVNQANLQIINHESCECSGKRLEYLNYFVMLTGNQIDRRTLRSPTFGQIVAPRPLRGGLKWPFRYGFDTESESVPRQN